MASQIKNQDSEIKQNLLICKCCNGLIESPKYLPCLHTYCETCLQTLAGVLEEFNCPQCGVRTKVPLGGVKAFPVASHLIGLAEYVQFYIQNNPSIPCFNKGNKDGHQDAAVKCKECAVYYCTKCDEAHKLSRTARNHTSVKLTHLKEDHIEKDAQKKVSKCEKHPDSLIEYFCLATECNILICRKCNIGEHKKHECIELEVKANIHRTEIKRDIDEYMKLKEDKLMKLEKEIKTALTQIEKEHDNNVQLIKEKTEEICKLVKNQEKVLLEQEEQQTNVIKKSYTDVRSKVKDKLTTLQTSKALIQNMTSFSPDDELVKLDAEIRRKIESALQESTSPELWIQSVSVTSKDQPKVDRQQKVRKSYPMRCQDTSLKAISSFAVFDNLTIALLYHGKERPTDVDVRGPDEAKAVEVKKRIEKYCPYAYRVVPMVQDGKNKMVMLNAQGKIEHRIKIMSLDCDEVEDLSIDTSLKPYAMTVDGMQNICYTNSESIKKISSQYAEATGKKTRHSLLVVGKKTDSQKETIFKNKPGHEVLVSPWYLTTNINGDLIVSDSERKALLIFNEKGKLIHTYEVFTPNDKPNPYGVCTCTNGWIYVSDHYGNCIHRLCETGVFKDKIITESDGLRMPSALQWYKDMLVVGQVNGQIKYFKI